MILLDPNRRTSGDTVEDESSYLQSMANQGYNPLVAIQIALAGRAVDNMGE